MAQKLLVPEALVDLSNLGDSLDAVFPIQYDYLSGWNAGEIASKRRGSGFEIDGVRDYLLGDDPRYIDWFATARNPEGLPRVREHEADITPALWVVSDVAHERYQTGNAYYSEFSLAVSAILTLMRVAEDQSIPIAMVASSDHDLFIQEEPLFGAESLLAMGRSLGELVPEKVPPQIEKRNFFDRFRHKSNPNAETLPTQTLRDSLLHVSSLATQSVVAVVSDFRDSTDPANGDKGWAEPLIGLAEAGHDIIALEIQNPWDDELPASGETYKIDGISLPLYGERGDAIRARYVENAAEQQAAIDRNLEDASATHIKLSVADPFWRTSLYEQLMAANQRQA